METFKSVWDTLSSIDVSDKTEKKGNLTYLSWAWAWGKLMEHYPTATYCFTEWEGADGTHTDTLVYPDGTCSVECEVTIEDLRRKMWLPVMDYRNNAIQSPTSRQISDTKMRCLVKCLAMFGLGHYIYAGEDLPSSGDSVEMKTEVAPRRPKSNTPKKERKLTAIQQGEKEETIELVKNHPYFIADGNGTATQILGVMDNDPTPAQISEYYSYVKGEASIYDNNKKDEEYNGQRR